MSNWNWKVGSWEKENRLRVKKVKNLRKDILIGDPDKIWNEPFAIRGFKGHITIPEKMDRCSMIK